MNGTGVRLPITAVMVIFNEESIIERSLRSFADLVDEIIIIHDGPCTDRSLEIARGFGAKVFEVEHWGEAEHHRVLTYRKSSNDWILQVDADEYLSSELREALPNLISSGVDLFDIAWPTVHAGRRFARGYKRSLFRKQKVYFIGVTHEFVKPLDARTVQRNVEYPLLHEPGYDDLSLATFRRKWLPWTDIHVRELSADFDAIPKWNYRATTWDTPMKLQLAHPIVVGMMTTPLFIWKENMEKFVRQPAWYFFKFAFWNSIYYIHLFRTVMKTRSERV